MSERLYPENRDTFKAYQDGTIDGVESVRSVVSMHVKDGAVITGAELKAFLNEIVTNLRFERDEWERKYGL